MYQLQTIFQTTKQLLMTSLVSASCILINLLLRCYISITVVHLHITSTLNFRQTVKCKATRIRQLTASRVPCKVVLSYHADACVEFNKRSFNIEFNLKGDIIVVSTMASQQRPLKPVYCFTKYWGSNQTYTTIPYWDSSTDLTVNRVTF